MTPLTLRFGRDMPFALTGADVGADIGGRAIPPWWRSQARAGDVLTLKAMTRAHEATSRSPAASTFPLVLGSRSTQLRGELGGLHGRSLQSGDVLPCAAPDPSACIGELGTEPADIALARPNAPEVLRSSGW